MALKTKILLPARTTVGYKYAVRLKGTDKYFIEPDNHNRLSSHMEPMSLMEARPRNIRLFESGDAAKIAISHWAKGQVVTTRSSQEETITEVIPVKGRRANIMEVVQVHLIVIE